MSAFAGCRLMPEGQVSASHISYRGQGAYIDYDNWRNPAVDVYVALDTRRMYRRMGNENTVGAVVTTDEQVLHVDTSILHVHVALIALGQTPDAQ